MADMVLLKCEIGSKAATVLCPECGRISRQILSAAYSPNRVAELIRPHTCPICETVYQNCSPSQAGNWSAAFARYNNRPAAYNESVKEDYSRKAVQRVHEVETSSPEQIRNSEIETGWINLFSMNILKRGKSYFNTGKVRVLARTPNEVSGLVRGTSAYTVRISFNDGQVKDMYCSCPYAQSGERCKHQAAMLFALREGLETIEVPIQSPKTEEDRVEVPKPASKPEPARSDSGASLVSALKQAADRKAEEAKGQPPLDKAAPAAQLVRAEKDMPSMTVPYLLSTETLGRPLSAISMPAPASQEAPATPDEDLDRKIERWKRELLDTGKRNKMINFRETKRATLRILEPEATELFNKLAFSDKPLTFQKPINKDTDLRTYSMIALMETLSYTLNVQVGDIKTAGTIIEREKTLKNLRAKAKLAQEEQGTNILYLCFGFIYWREHNRESSPWFKAPLLMMPVTLGLKSLSSPYTLSRYDDEIEVNPTLDYLFNTEYHIDLPTFDLKNRQSFDEYFAQIEEIVDKRGWKVLREVSLGLLSFLKISMYHDLNNNRELMVNHPVLRAMAGDRHAIGDLPAQAENFDFDGVKPDEWHEVVDSDSSQEEAILLSKLGVSFVMQGPPGTGKSQTITNIIAEALADGKKVLFVSEKAAALQVVLKRLTEVGLDDFCLSLHNYKANKKEIIDSIGANLSLEDEYIDSSALRELTELFHDRAFLNSYAGDLHRPIAPLDQSVYMVFGKISKFEKATVLEFSLDKPTEITKEQYASFLYCVSAFEKALHNMDGKLSANPWFGTKANSSGQTYKMQLLHDTEGLSASLRRIESLSGRIATQLGAGEAKSFSDARRLLDISSIISARPPYMSNGWFSAGIPARGQEINNEARQHAVRLHQHKDTIFSAWDSSILSIEPDRIRDHFCGDFSWIYNAEGYDSIEKRLADQKDIAESLKVRLKEIISAYHDGLQVISYHQADTTENIRMLRKVLSLIGETPYMEASWFDARRNAEIAPLIEEAIQHSSAIRALTEDILKDWEPTAFDIDADGMLARFKTEYVGMFHAWKSSYKEDIKTLRLHSKVVGGKIDESTVIDFLQKIKELKAEKAWFQANAEALTTAMGSQYRGETTEWSRVRESMSKALEITNEFPYSSISGETISALLKVTDSLQLSGEVRRIVEVLSAETMSQLEEEIKGCRYISEYSDESDILVDILPQITSFIENCGVQGQYVAEFTAAKKDSTLFYEDITDLLSNVAVVKEEQAWFADQRIVLSGLFADAYKEDESDWDAISLGLMTADRLSALFEGATPETIIQIVCGQITLDASFQTEVSELAAFVAEAEPKMKAFSAQFDADEYELHGLSEVADHYDACMDGFGELNKWLDYAETREECDKHGLADFTARIAELDNTVPDVQAAFERGFYIQWLNQQLDGVPAVQSFRRRIHEQRSERFVKLDTKQYEIARKRIRERIISTYPNLNRVARAGSELGILRHEMEKKRRIMPLRKLFQSIPTLLLTLKPCLMMSPLSVAYFLDAKAYQFDMVIFDEASQIFPQDAIGAIFRAKQVVIAGDTKQLPPTNFFAASTSNSSEGYDDDEGYDEEVYDSILEETANILPNRTLLWHYRSKHEHLIAFSNQEIYKNELVTFPSSNESEPDTGVEFVYVEDGYYEPSPRNYNVLEARRIVELVKDHIEKYSNRSLGIIAFSEKQQQAIALEIQCFREKHSEYEAFFAEGKEDGFFVKNLENVQGDERDTIFFSVGYAKTKEQKANGKSMSMRFGPLGVSGGERRLNVAITRAKINVKLVSSILPSDIDLSRTESDGIRMLRSYIEFAMNGEATLAAAHKNGRPDDFADSIAQFIRDQGFEVQQYVGCSGYKIDIAVKHPSDLVEQFVAGIECDGYSYVSARTARDRDRLRSSVLTNMGWNLYRVWSAEWYKNPEIEGQKLVAFLQRSIRACDERIKVLEEQKKKEEEAKRAELEKARAAREAEERRKQREQEAKEAKLRAEHEEAERKRREEAERKAAKLRADQEAARKREEERKQTEEQRRREAELKRQQSDLTWVKPGARVNHNRYGAGVVLAVAKDIIRVQFGLIDRTLSYPSVFENGILTKPVPVPEPPKAKGPEWAVVGAAITHKSFGDGVIETIDGAHMSVRFGNVVKPFLYPDAFTAGHLSKGSKPEVQMQMELFGNKRKGFVAYLKRQGYAETSANAMASAVSRIGDYAIKEGFSTTPIYEMEDLSLLTDLWNRLENNHFFVRFNNSQNGRSLIPMRHYIDFLSSISNGETKQESGLPTMAMGALYGDSKEASKNPETPTPVSARLPLVEALKNAGFRCIDNRTTSSILWVLYEPAKKDTFEKTIAGYNVQCKLEKRGALATNNSPAWRIMFN